MKNNVCDNNSIRYCSGCGICAPVCSTKAISIEHDIDGFYKPVIDESKCVECGMCKKSCYRYDENFTMSDDVLTCYAAYNLDVDQLASSSSGGISRLLMEESIARGYKVIGCAYDLKSNKAKSVVVSTIEELDLFYGSKYFQSYTVDGFEEILKDRNEQKYAIFGTPCQIYVFSQTGKYKRTPEKYLLVDIFCHGCPTVKLWEAYRKHTEKLTKSSSFDKIAFRSKTYGWHEYSIDFFTKSKKHSSKKIFDSFFDLLFGGDVMNMACYDCKARSTMAYADIRIGDYWGTKYELNTKGVSAIIVKSTLGNDFIEVIKDKMTVEPADFQNIISAQSYGKTVKYSETRRSFLLKELEGEPPMDKLNKKYRKLFPAKRRIKVTLKAMVRMLPPVLFFPIRKMLHSF